ncbi:MAG: hypothetical protein GF364_12960 [Candidatus Lokiarchaeota archaeon]|nr:hypothetical protein [Candidatus Lokiarchaeota archaeon]
MRLADMKFYKNIEDLPWKFKYKIKRLFKKLDLSLPQLDDVRSHVRNKEWVNAARALIKYYEMNRDISWLDYPEFQRKRDYEEELDDIFDDIFTFQTVREKVPRTRKGNLDWGYKGPNNDREFGFFLNRQHYLKVLYKAYENTGNEKYVRKFDDIMLDWLIYNPRPFIYRSSVQWRTLEVALRSKVVWPYCFFGFQNSDEFSETTRILMLIATSEHATYCKRYVVPRGNIRVMILNALATMGALWPEFEDSKDWIRFAVKDLTEEILHKQVYPDGAQKELSNHYHYVAMSNFEHLANMAEKGDVNLNPDYRTQLEKMWNYHSYNIRPNGYGLLNNDADYDYVRDSVIEASKRFNRPDWSYIALHSGSSVPTDVDNINTEQPEKKSVVFPWAGHAILRNKWDPQAHWCFFDFGPFGTGHQHRDKLHLSINAYGRDLLVDSGRYYYIGDKWRRYFRGTRAHNTITINGHGQRRYKKENNSPIPNQKYRLTDDYDAILGAYCSGYTGLIANPEHIRALIYFKNKYWIVIDRVLTEQPITISTFWHFHPKCSVKLDNKAVFTADGGKGNIRITPSLDLNWKLKLIKGVENPEIQGWYSSEYNQKEPNWCAIYNADINPDIDQSTYFAWFIDTSKDTLDHAAISIRKVFNNQKEDEIYSIIIKKESIIHKFRYSFVHNEILS